LKKKSNFIKITVEPHKQIITKGDFLDIFLFE
jgi:hypothetical protein